MKRLFGLTVLALILSAIPAQAAFFNLVGNGQMPVGPWYLYWPLEAHFQTPASPHYPYWPAPMTLPLPQGAAQGMPSYNPYAAPGQTHAQVPAMNGSPPYAGAGNPGMQPGGMAGYNPYGTMPQQGGYNPYGMGGYQGGYNSYGTMPQQGGYNPYGMGGYQGAPTLPAGGANNSAPTIRIGN